MDFNISLINRLAICWLAVSLLGSLPYLLSGEVTSIADAFFESASGFSATGATALGDVESYSKGLLIWRSLTQWLGGVGFL
ncbi:MAG: hypothetical protein FWF84_00460, partial [Kiritimatiellaeota bacterium]|nr:hypothetical protein [Kiritimatiellota bacterium]